VAGFIKGKNAVFIARNFAGRRWHFSGESFWASGFHVSTVGRDEDVTRDCIRHQEKEDQRLEQFKLLAESAEGWRIYSNRFERFSVFRHPALPGGI